VPELSQKLGAKPGAEVLVFFTTRRAELERRFAALKATLGPADGLWIACSRYAGDRPESFTPRLPKVERRGPVPGEHSKAAKLDTDLDFDAVRSTGLAHGLVDNKSASIDETWQVLRFVYRLEDR
jgi:hypothetical protein